MYVCVIFRYQRMAQWHQLLRSILRSFRHLYSILIVRIAFFTALSSVCGDAHAVRLACFFFHSNYVIFDASNIIWFCIDIPIHQMTYTYFKCLFNLKYSLLLKIMILIEFFVFTIFRIFFALFWFC